MSGKKIKKRERGANYTPEEKTMLTDLITQFKYVIEDKRTGGHIINKKKEAWTAITIKYNSYCTTGPRQTDQLKTLYDNMKQKSRKNVGKNNKLEYMNTTTGVKMNTTAAQDLQDTNSILVTTPSRVVRVTPARRKLQKNKVVQQKIKKPNSAKALKIIYFKKKCENANLERKKLLQEILFNKEVHKLKMSILKSKLDMIN